MKKFWFATALLLLLTCSLHAQEPCEVKEIGCVRIEVIGLTEDAKKNKTYHIRVTNNCTEELKYVVFKLPRGINADEPNSNDRYVAPSGREYKVRNPNHQPYHSIRFKATGKGIANGASDVFVYTLPAQARQAIVSTTVRLGGRTSFETHLTIAGCPVKQELKGRVRTEFGAGISKVGNRGSHDQCYSKTRYTSNNY